MSSSNNPSVREYLYGVKFTVIMDHQRLIWLFKLGDPNARLKRWVVYLQNFDYEIVYKKGRAHSNVDAKSRPVQLVNRKVASKRIEPFDNYALMYLKFGLHSARRLSKQVASVEELNTCYKLEQDGSISFRLITSFR